MEHGEHWYDKPPAGPFRGREWHERKLDAGGVRQIRKAHANGWSLYALGKRFSIDPATVRSIVRRETYKDVE